MTKSLSEIRSTFTGYFARQGHEIVSSSPLVPRNDPSLMFTTAGMVQFKDIFTGREQRSYSRAATAQKCVRAGGKHNDLENVGYTARHHTFFEMLGNFSFGDYFKEDAIKFAWELVTKELGLNAADILVTVYHTDDEAFKLWQKIAGLPEQKIIRIATDDNFWRMGDTGPCGPCTELFIDRGDKFAGGPPGSENEDGDRFLEFWNLVFMQYEQVAGGEKVPLPKPSIDTGSGLERLASIIQGAPSNYDIDLFKPILAHIEELVKSKYNFHHTPSFRVIADHLRSMCFLIADGVLPSNEGRGYVLRRIMRRAMRHAHKLGVAEPMIYKLVPTLENAMGTAYPELTRASALITETIKTEENRFGQTLVRGMKLLEEETAQLPAGGALAGDTAFKLYDTYGFPLDLTQDVLRSSGHKVDTAGFDAAMAAQKAAARASWKGSGEAATATIWFEIAEECGATDFLGYSTTDAEGLVVALVQNGARVTAPQAGKVFIITNQTPFYAESGGQVGDAGQLILANGASISISDTQKQLGKLHVHEAALTAEQAASLKIGTPVRLVVDAPRRQRIKANHSSAHLAHEALRRVLGDHVAQKGSLVDADKMRFDFSHPKAMTATEIKAVEDLVNARIWANDAVTTQLMTPDDAVAAGALALFGEKYGDEVRVLSMGGQEASGKHYSVELCGGTHVNRTGDIGLFKITSESAVAAGVRRIEAVTGAGAKEFLDSQTTLLDSLSQQLKIAPTELPARLATLLDERKKLERDVAEMRQKLALTAGGNGKQATDVQTINGIKLLARNMGDLPARDLKPMADTLKAQLGSGIVALASSFEGKASLVVAITPDLASKLSAVTLVNAGASVLGGTGGGRADLAQAGGSNVAGIDEALAAIAKAV